MKLFSKEEYEQNWNKYFSETIEYSIIVGNVGGYTDVYSTFWGYSPFIVCNRYENSKIKITRTVKDITKLHKIFFNRRKG